MLCDSQLWEVSIITGLQGTAEFLSCFEKMNRSFGIHKKHSSMVPLPADKYEANIRSERTPQMARMEPYLPRQPPWFKCFLMVSRSWIPTFNWWMEISMEIWKVAWLDKWNLFMLPIITNMTQVRMSLTMPEDLATQQKKGLKRTPRWAAHYFINKKSYPVPSNFISFWDIPFLPSLPTVTMDMKDQECMREWACNCGKCTLENCSTRNHLVQGRYPPP